MNRYILKPGFEKNDRELLVQDFTDYLLLITHKLLPKTKNPLVVDGYRLFIKDIVLAIALIDKANKDELSAEDAKNTILFCKSTHKILLSDFYDEIFMMKIKSY